MKHDEEKLQMQVVEYIRLQYPGTLTTITPGGLIKDNKTGCKANKMGYQKGWPDLFIAKVNFSNYPLEYYSGLYMEFKTIKGKLTLDQINKIKQLSDEGYKAGVFRSFEESKIAIDWYLKKE